MPVPPSPTERDVEAPDAGPDGHAVPRRRRRWLKPLAWALAAVLVLCAAAVGGYAWHLRRTVSDNVQRAPLLPDAPAEHRIVPQDDKGNLVDSSGKVVTDQQGKPVDAGAAHVDAKGQIVDQQGKPILSGGKPILGTASEEVAQPKKVATSKNSLNYLVLGSDSRGSDQGRSDVIVVAHVSDDRKRVDLVHFPRDLYVTIPGRGKNKINAAYQYGGAPLLVQTIQPLIGVPIDHVATIDFNGFRSMTDAIGGVDVPTDSGVRHFDGTQGLAWVRERYGLDQGDISRGKRQMAFIRAVLTKGLSRDVLLNPREFSSYLDAGTRNMTVDSGFTVDEMQKVALSMRNVRGGDIHTTTAPWVAAEPGPNNMSIVVMSRSQMATLAEHLRTDSMATYVDNVSPKQGFGG